jgi:hypothetical protein
LLFVLTVSTSISQAQERIAPPPPDPIPSGPPAAGPSGPGGIVIPNRAPTTVLPPPSGDPGLFPPYPPPGPYGPPYPPRYVFAADPENPRFWFNVDAIIWWSKNQPVPANLVTTGPAASGSNPGGLGVAGTTSLTSPLDFGAQGGIQFGMGGWFTPEHKFGMDGSLFFLSSRGTGWGVNDPSGNGSFVINTPVDGAPFSTLISAPGIDTGNVFIDASTRFWGGDINLLYNLFRNDGWSLNLLGGFRGAELRENLNITANSTLFVTTTYTDNLGNVLATADPGSSVTVFDSFETRNQFYGGQVGAQLQYTCGRWAFDGAFKLALGNTHETININGGTAVFPTTGNPVFLSGGNFATIQSGHYSANKFAVMPTLQLNVGYQFTPWMRGTIGYNFMYLSNVVRPGNQIDNTFNGTTHPGVPFSQSGFWTQGINIGLHFIF